MTTRTRTERRRYPRYELDLPVTLFLAASPTTKFEAWMKDLSAGGCFFDADLPRDDFASVALSFRRGLYAPVATGKVVRRVPGRGFAVQFDEARPDVQRLVDALGALTPVLRNDFASGFLDPEVEIS